MSNVVAELEKFFHEKIPLTRSMGLRVLPNESFGFAIEAPVALNYNHLQTAFGGSINAIATLAAYGFLWMELRETAHLVVASSSIRFLRPIKETIRAVCQKPRAEDLEIFRAILREKKKAKLKLNVVVEENGECAAEFEGTFYALA